MALGTLTTMVVLCAIAGGISAAPASANTSSAAAIAVAQRFPDVDVGPTSWEYIRVELPAGFSLFSLEFVRKKWTSKDKAPLLCFRYGAPPLPSAAVARVELALQNASTSGACSWFKESTSVNVTNEQVLSGLLYIGVFSEPGPSRTQSTMISRGATYKFEVNYVVTECPNDLGGGSCDQRITPLLSNQNKSSDGLDGGWNTLTDSCVDPGKWSNFLLDVTGFTSKLEVMLDTANTTTCVARHAALPQAESYDFKMEPGSSTLTVDAPRIGPWYIGVSSLNSSTCSPIRWRVQPWKTAGPILPLERILTKPRESPFDSYYIPQTQSDTSQWFDYTLPKNDSGSGNTDGWVYLLVEVPRGSSGSVLSMELQHENLKAIEVYTRLGGHPNTNLWDFHYNSSEQNKLSFDMTYPAEGVWSVGVRYSSSEGGLIKLHMSLHGCSKSCSGSGSCRTAYDASRLGFFSFCHCDRTHGGVDCSETLLSRSEKRLQAWALVGSNAAAILPSLWSLRQKAYSEWLIYTTSGISSAIYHSCDAGGWCALPYDTLQFLDFWLSFLAVVFTCIYLAEVLGLVKSTLHIGAAIITAIIAKNDRTSTLSIILVIVLGTVGLLLGLALEFWRQTQTRVHPWTSERSLFHTLTQGTKAFVVKLRARFIWAYVGIGIMIVVFAGFSRSLENAKNYWIWHSLWHVSIFTGAFFLLFAVVVKAPDEPEGAQNDSSIEEMNTLQPEP